MGKKASKENKVIIDGQTYYGGLNQPNLKFIKVNVDCWEKIFDLLSLHDIVAMSQTCQRMRQIGGHYFRENYGISYVLKERPGFSVCVNTIPVKRLDFLRFVNDVSVSYDRMKQLRKLSRKCLLPSLTTLSMYSVSVLNEHQLRGLENIQTKIETIVLAGCSIDNNAFTEFLASCPKLTSLTFIAIDFKSPIFITNLFQRTYPMLKYFDYRDNKPKKIDQLIRFLERNPTIKSLRIADENLQVIPLNTTSIQLDYLIVNVLDATDASDLLKRLKTLHANGFYKKLRLSIEWSPDDFDSELFIRGMISFNALEVLYTIHYYTDALCHLTQLKELHLWTVDDGENFDTMAMNLNNLERLNIITGLGTNDKLLSFLRYSKNLKYVIFQRIMILNIGDENTLNLSSLNRVRQLGGMRQKVQIGVREDHYLTTKWMENGVDYDLVEIVRMETIRKRFDYVHH